MCQWRPLSVKALIPIEDYVLCLHPPSSSDLRLVFHCSGSPLECVIFPRYLHGVLPVPGRSTFHTYRNCGSCSSSALTAFSACTLTAMPLGSTNTVSSRKVYIFIVLGVLIIIFTAFAETLYYTNHFLQKPTFAPTSFYTQQLLHELVFTRHLLHYPALTPTSSCTNQLLPNRVFIRTTFCTNRRLQQPTSTPTSSCLSLPRSGSAENSRWPAECRRLLDSGSSSSTRRSSTRRSSTRRSSSSSSSSSSSNSSTRSRCNSNNSSGTSSSTNDSANSSASSQQVGLSVFLVALEPWPGHHCCNLATTMA